MNLLFHHLLIFISLARKLIDSYPNTNTSISAITICDHIPSSIFGRACVGNSLSFNTSSWITYGDFSRCGNLFHRVTLNTFQHVAVFCVCGFKNQFNKSIKNGLEFTVIIANVYIKIQNCISYT